MLPVNQTRCIHLLTVSSLFAALIISVFQIFQEVVHDRFRICQHGVADSFVIRVHTIWALTPRAASLRLTSQQVRTLGAFLCPCSFYLSFYTILVTTGIKNFLFLKQKPSVELVSEKAT